MGDIRASDTRSLYSPLNPAADEIRLLTLEPCLLGDILHCHLETISLKDTIPEYASFISSNNLSSQTPRQIKRQWMRSDCLHPAQHMFHLKADEIDNKDDSRSSIPDPSEYRFRWGDFAALSYVWGDVSHQSPIVMNGVSTTITANLEQALRSLSQDSTFTPTSGYKIWVDAICINQQDDHERSHQIQKMREIYSGAWSVISWICPPSSVNSSLTLAFPFLKLLASLKGDDRDLRKLVIKDRGKYFVALWLLAKQEYWFRLWIIQELIMGASCTILRLGRETITWDTFLRGIGVLYHGSNWLLKDEEVARELGKTNVMHPRDSVWHTYGIHLVHTDLRQLTRAEEAGVANGKYKRLSFRRLLDMANSSRCRDVKDKVFALVGMMHPTVAADVMAAYECEPPRLFAAVARAFIRHFGNLESLRHGNPWGPAGAPSWAADWTWRGRIRFSRPEYNMAGPLFPDPSEPEVEPDGIYRAHGGLQARFEFVGGHWGLLRCEGFVFDEVAAMGAPEAGFFAWDKDRMVLDRDWRSAYGGWEETRRALWRALLLDVVVKGERAEERHAALLNLPTMFGDALPQFEELGWEWMAGQAGYYFKWQMWRMANENFMLGDLGSLDSFFTERIPDDADERTYIEVYSSSQRTVQQRRFMLTRNGYLGWGPDNAYDPGPSNGLLVGDKIAIVFGCSTPVVIRPQGDNYQVVGEAYVQGFMDGEAVDYLAGEGFRHVQTFNFR